LFEILSEKLNSALARLTNKGHLTEKNIEDTLRNVRLALLEADVNFRVVKDFVSIIKERALNTEILHSLNPGQQVVKIVHEELTKILGITSSITGNSQIPNVLMLVGLQGSGKTTTAAKLAAYMRESGNKLLLVAADLRRLGAVEQLIALGNQIDVPVFYENESNNVNKVVINGINRGRELGVDWVILDTGGRIHLDQELMGELSELKSISNSSETLLVVDAMTGQIAVEAAKEFDKKIGLTGLIMTKLDGDARGGAALSITSVTGVPIKFIGVGEKADALEPFYPDRMASRILGMGDVLSLIEKAQSAIGKEEISKFEQKIKKANFNLEDFLNQIQQMKKIGSFSQILDMIPGFASIKTKMSVEDVQANQLNKVEAIINSMTLEERYRPEIINGSRRKRIAFGSGCTIQDINQILNQFKYMRKMMKKLASGKKGIRGLSNMIR